MANPIWDPYRILNITDRDSSMMYCFSCVQSPSGSFSLCEIPHKKFGQIQSILGSMEMRPPGEGYIFLSELTQLSLCSEHQKSKAYVVETIWRSAVGNAVRDYERLDMITRLNLESSALLNDLDSQLAAALYNSDQHRSNYTEAERTGVELVPVVEEQRAGVNGLQQANNHFNVHVSELSNQLASECCESDDYVKNTRASQADLSIIITDLEIRLDIVREVSAQRLNDLEELKVERDDLNMRTSDLQSQISVQYEQLLQLNKDLKASIRGSKWSRDIENLQMQLSYENINSEQLMRNLAEAERTREIISNELKDAKKLLEMEIHRSERLKKSLDETEIGKAVLAKDLENIRAKLDTELQGTEQLKRSLVEAGIAQATLSEDMEGLQAALSAERQNSEHLKKTCDETNTVKASVLAEIEKIRSERETERQNAIQLKQELGASNVQEEILSARLEELKTTAAAANEASSAEAARLQERINQAKESSMGTFLRAWFCCNCFEGGADQDTQRLISTSNCQL